MSDDVSGSWAASASAWIVDQGEPVPSGGDPDRIARHRRVPFFHIMEWQKPD